METLLKVLLVSMVLELTTAVPLPGFDSEGHRTRRDVHCRYLEEYQYGGICCALCPAGSHVASHCTRSGEMGKCEACDHGTTYTKYDNELNHCLPCTRCHSDQEIVRPCTTTQDAECQCKSGLFCSPNQACEVCKKCTRCGKDEEVVRNCTATTDTECKKIPPKPGSGSANVELIVTAVCLGIAIIICAVVLCNRLKKKREGTDAERNPSELKTGQHNTDNCPSEERQSAEARRPSPSNNCQLVRPKYLAGTEEERKVLCESLSSSASNSQHSLTGLPFSACNPLQNNPAVSRPLPNRREEEEFPTLVPVNGEESLRKCFEYFEEVEVDCYKRFFRQLSITDNIIKSKEGLPYEDRVHELLNIWIEKEGRDASLNHLLRALLALGQRRTAEVIMEKALQNDHYVHQC